MLRKLVSVACITAAMAVPFAFVSPASADDCIGYAQQGTLFWYDSNSDGKGNIIIYYPAAPNDVDPGACLTAQQSIPKTASVTP